MRSLLLFLLFLTLRVYCLGLSYISLVPSISNQAGTLPDKLNLNLEVGRQWEVFSLGKVIGKNSLAKAVVTDTTTFFKTQVEFKCIPVGKIYEYFHRRHRIYHKCPGKPAD